MNWRRELAVAAFLALLIVPTFSPQLLAFPHQARSGDYTVYSDTPIDQAALDTVVQRSMALVAASPVARPSEPRRVFLTDAGWRWTWLAIRFRDAFAVSRPLTEPLIFNRSNLARDEVYSNRRVGARRSLSGTIAHETCHGLLRRRFGLTVDFQKPVWLREGYCDHVANESALSDDDARRLRATEPDHPALPYYDGRKRVHAALARNGGNVDALFAAY